MDGDELVGREPELVRLRDVLGPLPDPAARALAGRSGLPPALVDRVLALAERWAIPAPGRPLFEAAAANFSLHSPAKVHTDNSGRGPLLLVMGGRNHTVPEAITRRRSGSTGSPPR